jgi:hypothetical protein
MSDDEIVKSVERLAEDVKEVGQAKLAGQDQEKYKWIDEFIRRVWAYKPAIEAEITRDPEASDSQIAKRVQMHAIPSPQRVDAQYATNAARIETYVRWIRGLAC